MEGNGHSANKRPGFLAPEGDEGCMWGTADNGRETVIHWFAKGDDKLMVVPGPGRLKLGPNDDNLADNSYDITVSIELKLIKKKGV